MGTDGVVGGGGAIPECGAPCCRCVFRAVGRVSSERGGECVSVCGTGCVSVCGQIAAFRGFP